jgi:hypothetical protein
MIWQALTRYWLHHDLFFTTFGSFDAWVRWNLHHFRHLRHIRQWDGWQALWSWVNIHG